MFALFGFFIICFSIITGFMMNGGNILVLLQPFELLIVLGSSIGIFFISNPYFMIQRVLGEIKTIFRKHLYTKEEYIEALVFCFYFFKFAKSKSPAVLEFHIENPHKSPLFRYFRSIHTNEVLKTFLCDYMRVWLIDANATEIERILDEDIQTRYKDMTELVYSIQRIADAAPALGIIGAVLGVINAMSSLGADPAVLARRIAGALMGTFLGVFISYCIVSPFGFLVERHNDDRLKFLEMLRAGIVAYARGNQPDIIIEFMRQSIPHTFRPSFLDLEKAIYKHKGNLVYDK